MPDRARYRAHHHYRIRKNGSHWIIYRHAGIFGWLPIAGHSDWGDALDAVDRSLRRVHGTQADYALASDGNTHD